MSDKSFSGELGRALARPDAKELTEHVDAYIEWNRGGPREWREDAGGIEQLMDSSHVDPDKALAYLMLAAARTDDARVLALLGAGLLEEVLRNPSQEFLNRIVAEARKTARFRWLLSVPFRAAISEAAWDAIEEFRIGSDHEEPTAETLPRKPWA